LRSCDWQRGRDAVKQALRQIGVNLEVSVDPNVGGGRQVHDVVAGERIGSEGVEPPGEFLHIDHLQSPPRVAVDPE
jgi:hypothetical protein